MTRYEINPTQKLIDNLYQKYIDFDKKTCYNENR